VDVNSDLELASKPNTIIGRDRGRGANQVDVKKRSRLKSIIGTAAVSIFIGAVSAPVFAQNAPGPAGRFDYGYLSAHPDVAKQLVAHPGLIDNAQFMERHPGLRDYLEDHPQVRSDIKNHPRAFMNRVDQLSGWHGPEGLGNTDRYFDQHPDVAQELNQNPKLIDNRAFIEQHPGLKQFLRTHRNAREDWRSHPDVFMHHEDRYGRTY
jgi:hypothetical protein